MKIATSIDETIKSVKVNRIKEKMMSSKKRTIIFLLMLFELLVLHNFSYSSHPYPKIGVFHWGGAAADWYSRFDLVITAKTSSDFARQIKALNPNTTVLPTIDWNAGGGVENIPDDWLVRDSQGNPSILYNNTRWKLVDITNHCPRSSNHNNKSYNEYLIGHMINRVDLTVFDGIATDGVWESPRGTGLVNKDFDLDRDGINDYTQHGTAWIAEQWKEGVTVTVSGIRSQIGNDKIIHLNSGRFHTSWWTLTNGFTSENMGYASAWSKFWNQYNSWKDKAVLPHSALLDGKGYTKNSYYSMRFLLGIAMIQGHYFSFSDRDSHEHHYDKYYDEFDVDLGQPTTEAVRFVITSNTGRGVWARFFEKGALIVNVDYMPTTVQNSQISGLNGYNGPYYRFKGGQVSSFNNGELFTSVEFKGRSEQLGFIGDAIILLKDQKTIVSDIIIDNIDAGTSPGSEAAQFVGDWVQINPPSKYPDIDASYSFGRAGHMGICNMAKTNSTGPSNQVIFQPTISIPGKYEVFEWHGFLGTDIGAVIEASDVEYEVTFTDGNKAKGILDQSINPGQWNSLGEYYFDTGTNGALVYYSSPTLHTIADAVKFVYQGSEPDVTPPNPPVNMGTGTVTETSIQLTWNTPTSASDGDNPASYRVYRDGQLVGSPIETQFTDMDLVESKLYTYTIHSIDNAGNLSQSVLEGKYQTSTDAAPPRLEAVQTLNKTTLRLFFNETIHPTQAVVSQNYLTSENILIQSAQLIGDNNKVELRTTEHTIGTTYTITVQNLMDVSVARNVIAAPYNTQEYEGISGDSISIYLSADNEFDLYINGDFIGSEGSTWRIASRYLIPTIAGKNVVAIKGIDIGGQGALIAEVDFKGQHYVSNTNWKVYTSQIPGWETVGFNDLQWPKATSYGLHGVTEPWSLYQKYVDGISGSNNVQWIWSSDWEFDNEVFFRLTLIEGADTEAPVVPMGIAVEQVD